MKYLSLFLLFLFIGIGIALGYFFWKKEKATMVMPISPKEKRFSIEPPPKESRIGTVSSMSGQILWESRIATKPAEIKDLKQVQQGEKLTTGKDGQTVISFPDAASITLSPESEIEFIQTLPIHFVFKQTKGKINYLKKGTIPLSVRSLHLLMTFSDCEYVINTDAENHILTLTVKKGSVKAAYNNLQYETQTVVINEGEKYVFNDDKRTGKIK